MIPATLAIVLGALVLIVLERIPALRRLPLRVLRPFFATDAAWLAAGNAGALQLVFLFVVSGSALLAAVGVPRLADSGMPLWAMSLVALVLIDLGNYLAHDLLHRVDALWEIHKVHHSSRHLDWLATYRSHLLEQVLRRVVAPLGLILVGVPLEAIGVAAAVFLAWAMLNHANLAFGPRWLEWVFITPRLHRIHHGTRSSDRNFGTVFSVWDRVFGRLDTRDVPADIELGVPGEADTYPQSFFAQLREPLLRIVSDRAAKRGGLSQQLAEISPAGDRADPGEGAPTYRSTS
jgi:sterol desaturase/sphingolipid hydroxylase (fatty acid hydroxylase superfamily)